MTGSDLNRLSPLEDSPGAPRAGGRLDVLLYGLVILAIALAFQGSRGLFQPDEGRYVNAALAMLRSGDWLVPRLHGLVYLDKPPAIYWSIAAGIKLLGANEWGARLASGVAFAATAWLVAAWAGAAWGKRVGRLAGAVYVTSLFPALAANALTPDTLLAVWTTAASFAYWQWRGSRLAAERWRWALLLGVALGFGMLTKGTAALVFLGPVVLHAVWDSGPRRLLSRPELWVAALLGTAIGLSWYLVLARDVPGAAQYFWDNQVAGRLWAGTYERHSEWWAAATVYLPVLALGGLPWSLTWLRRPRGSEPVRSRLAGLWSDPLARFLALSALLPLAVFSIASSKLILYILPIFPYLAMLTVAQARRIVRPRWGRRVLITAGVLILLRGAGAVAGPIRRDTRGVAAALQSAAVGTDECIATVAVKIHGLGLYGYNRVTWHALHPEPYPYFERPRTLVTDLPALTRDCGGRLRVLVKSRKRLPAVDLLAAAPLTCTEEPLFADLLLFSCEQPG